MTHAVRAFGLDGIYPYVKRGDEFKRNGFKKALEWQAIRGTPSSFHIAFNWAELPKCVIHEVRNTVHWTDYSIEVPRKMTAEELETIKGICKICEPAKSRLTRIFTTSADKKMLVPSSDEGALGCNIPSDNSGYYDQDGVLIAV